MLIARRRPGAAPRLWDGAIGTELIARGLRLEREPPEAWNLRRPDEVRALHGRYLAAGAEVIQTNTFGGSRPRLEKAGLDGELRAIQREAVSLARAAGARTLVGSLGPTGIDPFASDAAARIGAAYEEQLGELAAAGVDGIHLETMYHPVEALAGLAAARRVAPSLPVIVSATFALGDLGFQTPLGVPLRAMVEPLRDAEPDALGLNCSLEARKMLGALRALRELTELPLLVQPQAGEPSVGCKGERRGDDPARFSRDVLALVDEGADAVGGCCGAGPDHVALLARHLRERT
jgi:5-methyltetrahydrofolate--homocysteine methyltransferase